MTKTIYTKIDKLLDLLIKYFEPDESGEDEIIYEEPERPSEIISACANAMNVIDGLDEAMMSEADKQRIRSIRRKSLRLTNTAINAIYETNIEESND